MLYCLFNIIILPSAEGLAGDPRRFSPECLGFTRAVAAVSNHLQMRLDLLSDSARRPTLGGIWVNG